MDKLNEQYEAVAHSAGRLRAKALEHLARMEQPI